MTSNSRPSPPNQPPGAPHPGAPRRTLFDSFTRLLNVIGTILILVMAVAVNADVIGRNAFLYPLPGVLEFVGLAIVTIVFLQMANTLREGRHVSNDIFIVLVAPRWPRVAAALYALFNLVGAVLMALIVWFVWPILVDNYRGEFYRGTFGIITIPTWPFIAPIIIGAVATGIQFLLLARDSLRQALGRTPA